MASLNDENWKAVEYEYAMYFALQSLRETPPDDPVLKNAIVEGVLLHARILIDMLTRRKKYQEHDILLRELIAESNWVQQLCDARCELIEAYSKELNGNSDAEKLCPRLQINKMLAHLTTYRGGTHDNTKLFEAIEEPLATMLRLVAEATGRPGLQRYFMERRMERRWIVDQATPSPNPIFNTTASTNSNFTDTGGDGVRLRLSDLEDDHLGDDSAEWT